MEYEAKYRNGHVLRKLLSENTSKYHRKKTEEEEAGEQYSRHLEVIAEKHAEVCEQHAEDAEEDEELNPSKMSQFMLSDFIEMKTQVDETQSTAGEEGAMKKGKGKATDKGEGGVRAENRARVVQGNLFAQLALAFINRTHHYHHADLFDVKTHQSWMPGYQGVSHVIDTSESRCTEEGLYL